MSPYAEQAALRRANRALLTGSAAIRRWKCEGPTGPEAPHAQAQSASTSKQIPRIRARSLSRSNSLESARGLQRPRYQARARAAHTGTLNTAWPSDPVGRAGEFRSSERRSELTKSKERSEMNRKRHSDSVLPGARQATETHGPSKLTVQGEGAILKSHWPPAAASPPDSWKSQSSRRGASAAAESPPPWRWPRPGPLRDTKSLAIGCE